MSERRLYPPPVNEARHPRLLPVSEEARVTPIELFFDLVFVFSLT